MMPIFPKKPPFAALVNKSTSDEISTNYETKEVTDLLTGKKRRLPFLIQQVNP
jgi:hypothetical protein